MGRRCAFHDRRARCSLCEFAPSACNPCLLETVDLTGFSKVRIDGTHFADLPSLSRNFIPQREIPIVQAKKNILQSILGVTTENAQSEGERRRSWKD